VKSIHRWILPVLIVGLCQIEVGMAQSNAIGRWQQTDFLGISVLSEQCVYASYVTRKLLLDAPPQGVVSGIYTTYEQRFWVSNVNNKCALPDKRTGDAIFQRVRIFPVAITREGGGALHLDGEFQRCDGDFCDDPNLFRSAFSTRIKIQGDTLVDEAKDINQKMPIVYRKEAAANDVAQDAADTVDVLMEPLDKGECNRYVVTSLMSTNQLRQHQSEYCGVMRKAMVLEPKVLRTEIMSKVVLDRVVSKDQIRSVDEVLISSFVVFQDGTTLPRLLILRKEGGGWKVALHMGR
jgi:hypothetical protein